MRCDAAVRVANTAAGIRRNVILGKRVIAQRNTKKVVLTKQSVGTTRKIKLLIVARERQKWQHYNMQIKLGSL